MNTRRIVVGHQKSISCKGTSKLLTAYAYCTVYEINTMHVQWESQDEICNWIGFRAVTPMTKHIGNWFSYDISLYVRPQRCIRTHMVAKCLQQMYILNLV